MGPSPGSRPHHDADARSGDRQPVEPAHQGGRSPPDRRRRAETGLTLVDGARELRRALDAGADVVEAFVCEPRLAGEDARAVLDALAAHAIQTTSASEAAFGKIAFGDRAEGLVGVVRIPSMRLDDLAVPDEPLIVVVEGVEKPGNLGAVLRSADGAGVDALIAASPKTDLMNPNAIRASAGTIFSVPLASAPTEEVLDWLRRRSIRIVAALVDAEPLYTDADLTGPLAIAFGSEAAGLTDARGERPRSVACVCRCSGSPTASMCRSPRRWCCTRRDGNATVSSARQTDAMDSTFDLIVIGAGPGGEAATHKARSLGAAVAVVDRKWFGGSCPHIGCLPSKALLIRPRSTTPTRRITSGRGRRSTATS